MWIYLLKCSDGSYHTGVTNNLRWGVAEHQSGGHEGYTAVRLPVELVFSKEINTPLEAIAAEKQIKKWSRAKKKH